ncbi:MAG: Cys-tRNA(Pro) deacylase [Saprospiraceae bacterium]
MSKTNAIRLLEKEGIAYRVVPYTYNADNLDVAKIAADNGLALAQVFKTLVCKGDKTGIVVAVIPGDQQLDLKTLAQASGNKKIALLPMGELQAATGYMRGGCSPIGMKKNYPVYLDRAAEPWDEILINAGARGLLFAAHPVSIVSAFGMEWM